jgi:hypothetical protein
MQLGGKYKLGVKASGAFFHRWRVNMFGYERNRICLHTELFEYVKMDTLSGHCCTNMRETLKRVSSLELKGKIVPGCSTCFYEIIKNHSIVFFFSLSTFDFVINCTLRHLKHS